MLDVPHEVVEYVSWLVYARRRELNSRWRRLGCFRQALLTLVHLRKNETLAQSVPGSGSRLRPPAGMSPKPSRSSPCRRLTFTHFSNSAGPREDFVIIDGTLIPTDRIAADEPYYSMKHRRHGPHRIQGA